MPRNIYETTIYNIVSVVDLQDVVMLNGFGTVVNALGKRVKPYLPQICGTILWRLNNKSAKVRQQAADLISRIAVVMKTCQEVSHQIVCLIRDIQCMYKQDRATFTFPIVLSKTRSGTCILTRQGNFFIAMFTSQNITRA